MTVSGLPIKQPVFVIHHTAEALFRAMQFRQKCFLIKSI